MHRVLLYKSLEGKPCSLKNGEEMLMMEQRTIGIFVIHQRKMLPV